MHDEEIRAAARDLVEQFGEDAGDWVLGEAKDALIAGDDEKKDLWIRILKAICDLQIKV